MTRLVPTGLPGSGACFGEAIASPGLGIWGGAVERGISKAERSVRTYLKVVSEANFVAGLFEGFVGAGLLEGPASWIQTLP